MSPVKLVFLGMTLAWTPGLLWLGLMLWRCKEDDANGTVRKSKPET